MSHFLNDPCRSLIIMIDLDIMQIIGSFKHLQDGMNMFISHKLVIGRIQKRDWYICFHLL